MASALRVLWDDRDRLLTSTAARRVSKLPGGSQRRVTFPDEAQAQFSACVDERHGLIC